MPLQIYTLSNDQPFDLVIPLEYKREVKSYTNGEPYINVTISETIRMEIRNDGEKVLFFNNPDASHSTIQRLTRQDAIEDILDTLNIETNFR